MSQPHDHAGNKNPMPRPVIDANQRIKDLSTEKNWEMVRGMATCIVLAKSQEDREGVIRVMFEMLVSPDTTNLVPLGQKPDPGAPPTRNVTVRLP